ncbi:MAG: ATP-NAD kinase family protein [Methanotrichaceae archaeon]|nr:ATP-NAD kinase family protein [Methanotrichaceae archaeon]
MLNCQNFNKIGFLINPIAGLGGTVGLKGTDGLSHQALAMGAKPIAADRAKVFLKRIAPHADHLLFLAANGQMGEKVLKECELQFNIVYHATEPSSANDTRATCKAFIRDHAHLAVFCGGDGTARDVASVVDSIPILGIPAGVKMHSGVFAISPEAAADLAIGYIRGELKTRETEILDVDEEKYRQGELETRLYSMAKTPYKPVLVQERKRIYQSDSEESFKDQIAFFAKEFMQDGSIYILGAGTTTSKIANVLGLEKTLLGVDVIKNGKLILRDASERDLLKLLNAEEKFKIIVSPIGAQGFILGRGVPQISASVLRRIGTENLIIVSTPHKLNELTQLLVYTSDHELDKTLSGKRQVVTGYRIAQLKHVKAASEIE